MKKQKFQVGETAYFVSCHDRNGCLDIRLMILKISSVHFRDDRPEEGIIYSGTNNFSDTESGLSEKNLCKTAGKALDRAKLTLRLFKMEKPKK